MQQRVTVLPGLYVGISTHMKKCLYHFIPASLRSMMRRCKSGCVQGVRVYGAVLHQNFCSFDVVAFPSPCRAMQRCVAVLVRLIHSNIVLNQHRSGSWSALKSNAVWWGVSILFWNRIVCSEREERFYDEMLARQRRSHERRLSASRLTRIKLLNIELTTGEVTYVTRSRSLMRHARLCARKEKRNAQQKRASHSHVTGHRGKHQQPCASFWGAPKKKIVFSSSSVCIAEPLLRALNPPTTFEGRDWCVEMGTRLLKLGMWKSCLLASSYLPSSSHNVLTSVLRHI